MIYLITNLVNGKYYVGKTETGSAARRWRGHLWAAVHGLKTSLSAAIRKYGEASFHVSTLASADSRQSLTAAEIYWISLLDATNPACGYNLTTGGEGNPGTVRSAEYLAQLSAAAKARWSNPEWAEKTKARMRGRSLTLEQKEAISRTLTGRKGKSGPKNLSHEQRQRMAEVQRDKWADPIYRQRQREAKVGRRRFGSALVNMSKAAILRQSSPEYRARMSESIKRMWKKRKEEAIAHGS